MSQQTPSSLNCLTQALKNDQIDKSDLNIDIIKQYIRDNKKLDDNITQHINSRDAMAFQFIRLQAKKLDKQPLYGSNAPSTTALELSVCTAKQTENGEWLPDEDNIIFMYNGDSKEDFETDSIRKQGEKTKSLGY